MLVTDQVLAERYRIDRLLGHGGMGAVYQATHVMLGQKLAIKELNLGATDPEERQQASQQFRAEGQILSHLAHVNLPRMYDFFEENGHQYLVMDFIEGTTLERLVESQGRMTETVVRALTGKLCDVLEYLHLQHPPIIFRDLKPSNIMVTHDSRLFLIDFGIAKILERSTGRGTQTFARNVGSPGYAAPEQYSEGTEIRTDIYALGATLYTLLTGTVPPPSVSIAAGTTPLTPLRQLAPEVSGSFAYAIERMMKVRADERLPDAAGVRRSLTRMTIGLDKPTSNSTVTRLVDRSLTRPTLPGPHSRAVPTPPAGAITPNWTAPPTSILIRPRPRRSSLGMWLACGAAVGFLIWAQVRIIQHLRDDMGRPHSVAASPLPARLIIRSTPTAAHILLDGAKRGKTPLTVDGLHLGTLHEVKLTLPGRTSGYRSLILDAGNNVVELALPLAPGQVVGTTSPDSVQVYVGKKVVGRTGTGHLHLDLPPGTYRLEFRSPNYYGVTQTISLRGAQTIRVAVHLQPASLPALYVVSSPGAQITVDGTPRGPAPLRLTISPGLHTIEARGHDGRNRTTLVQSSAGPGQISVNLPLPTDEEMWPNGRFPHR